MGYRPWGRKESDMTERLSTAQAQLDVMSSPESSLSWEKPEIMISQTYATGSCLKVGEEEGIRGNRKACLYSRKTTATAAPSIAS